MPLSGNEGVVDWDDRFSEESISDELIRTHPIFEPLLNKIHHFFHHSRKFVDSGIQFAGLWNLFEPVELAS